ncbi:UDP-glucose dehydrogenase family protein [Chloroflexota bacterium]
MNSVSVFGIGKLGLPLAACLANKSYQVIGVDLNQDVIRAVNEGRSPYYEPGLTELVESAGEHLSATDDYHHALHNSEMSFIVVPTPSEPDGSFSTKYVEISVEQIATSIKEKSDFHVVVLSSTVLPGATEGVIKQLLEKVSGKKCGKDFGLCYSPEFIALGSVIRDFTNPDVVLIGESDPKSGDLLAEVYRKLCENQPPIVRTTIQNAELAKISLNAFVTMKITFANTLAEIAEKLPGGDVDAVSKMLGFDSRIGRKYLSGSIAYGGPCFPRDNKAFSFVAKKLGCQAKLAMATDEVNQEQVDRVIRLIEQKLVGVKGKNVAVLGLTYKPDTDVIEESASVKIAVKLAQKGAMVSVHDPAGMENARQIMGEGNIRYADSAVECLKDSELCLVATPWDAYKSLTPSDFNRNMKKPRLLDCWRLFNRPEFREKVEYFAIGLGS